MDRLPLLRLIGCLLFLISCQKESKSHSSLATPPAKETLLGIYRPTDSTLRFVAASGKYESRPASITLGPHGALEIENLPDCWLSPYKAARGQLDSGKGSWELARQQKAWVVMCNFPSLPNHGEGGNSRVTAMFSLAGQRPPYALEAVVSHPDAELVLRFEKTSG